MIDYRCPHCSAAMSSPDSLIGEEETCPQCGLLQEVPGVRFLCQRCNKPMKAPLAKTGAPVRCDNCTLVQNVPGSVPAVQPQVKVRKVGDSRPPQPSAIPPWPEGQAGIRITIQGEGDPERPKECPEFKPYDVWRKERNSVPASAAQIRYAMNLGLTLPPDPTNGDLQQMLTLELERRATEAANNPGKALRDLGIHVEPDASDQEIQHLLVLEDRVRHYLCGLWIQLAGESCLVDEDSRLFVQEYKAAIINQDKGLAAEIADIVGEDRRSEEFLAADPDLRKGLTKDFTKKFKTFSGRPFPRMR